MRTLKLEIEDSKLDIVLNIIRNLKDDIVHHCEVVDDYREKSDDDIKTFSNHSASLIEEWYDVSEDEVWK